MKESRIGSDPGPPLRLRRNYFKVPRFLGGAPQPLVFRSFLTMKNRWLTLAAGALVLATAPFTPPRVKAGPGDWPGWRGPDRTGVSKETGLLKEWPKEGPKLLWKADGLGGGFSTPSVAGGRIYLLGTDSGRTELLMALDAKNGKQLWAREVGSMAGGHPGPRSTPTVDGDRVYVISSNGKLVCAETAKGEIQW